MKNGVYLLAVSVLLCVWTAASTDSEVVWLTDVTASIETDRRTLSDLDLPDDVKFHVRGLPHELTLNLRRNRGIDPNADIYVVRRLKDGPSLLEKTQNLEKEDLAYYQDSENGAFMTVRCVRKSKGHCDRRINGHIRIIDKNYYLRPAKSDVTSRISLETTDRLAVDDKNSTEINEEMKVNERTYQLRRLPHGHEVQNHLHIPNTTLSARNIRGLHKRYESSDNGKKPSYDEKKNNGNAVYWIEVAVLLDSSIWNHFHSLTDGGDHQVQRNLREFYSHVMNGVNLLYNGIQDSSIKITITLRNFFILQTIEEMDHSCAKVYTRRGKQVIDARKYLKDLSEWDIKVGSAYGIDYDHLMVFTRYDLYEGNYRYNAIHGVSYDGDVCDTGRRISLIEVGDPFSTVSTAAHELAHNLGADHDGEGKATNCKSEDFYIMSVHLPEFDPAKPYSRNPWLFSVCSVEAFKNTLKDKTCVTNVGVVFDESEWNQYVTHQPGEVYKLNQQCEFINGPKSVFCGDVSADICLFMKCTDPETKQCQSKYLSAARGTACGPLMTRGLPHSAMYDMGQFLGLCSWMTGNWL